MPDVNTNCEVQGMPQNMYTQIITALVNKYAAREVHLTPEELGNTNGCLIYFENGILIVKGY